ncbi:hypothetical protein GCM10009557_02510 [Virgisporangium ochraceum]|uniref:Uncharacterized protein n=1 Tax=Virgisporangium ochraceum TaxID=65505 RepID=A0A8J3ZZ38_9ACTN|nr:hypothetical protein Voc01_077410 [Virgisporangium ochraceum]
MTRPPDAEPGLAEEARQGRVADWDAPGSGRRQVIHVSWRDVLADLRFIRVDARGQERTWLDHLNTYLRRVVRLRSIAESWTYRVALNDARPADGGARTFLEFVTDDHVYFHPYGVSGWPTDPPSFMAFRWQGAVRRIHRVIKADVPPSLLDRWPDLPATRRHGTPTRRLRPRPATSAHRTRSQRSALPRKPPMRPPRPTSDGTDTGRCRSER